MAKGKKVKPSLIITRGDSRSRELAGKGIKNFEKAHQAEVKKQEKEEKDK